MTLQYRTCQANDVNDAVPLMYSAGPEAYRYVFSVDYEDQAIDFLRFAFVKGKGEFGYSDHILALNDNKVVGLVGRRESSQNLSYTVAAIKQIFGFYGFFKGLKVIVRGLKFEHIVAPPSKGRVSLHNLGVIPDSRGKGYGQAIIKYFIDNEKKGNTQFVCLDVASTNPRAKALYQRLGFVVKKHQIGKLINKYGRGVDHEYMEIDIF